MTLVNKKSEDIPWIEKYRPKTLKEISQNDKIMSLLNNSSTKGEVPHLLFYGPPGTGKTSAILALGREIFKEYYSTRVIEFNASDDRGINSVKGKISTYAKQYVATATSNDGSIIPPYKIIVLDEADSMTEDAQDALRVIIEQYSRVTRFCFIGNHVSKITDAIKSRCTMVYFRKLTAECMSKKLSEVAQSENMNLDGNIINTIIDVSNGDMRKAIMLLHNYKYTFNFKSDMTRNICDIPFNKIEIIANAYHSNISDNISADDIYEMAGIISLSKANDILEKTIKAKKILQVSAISKKILSTGYPVDNIVSQINKAIISRDNISDNSKAMIILHSGEVLFRIKECASEEIQLLDYLTYVNRIVNNK